MKTETKATKASNYKSKKAKLSHKTNGSLSKKIHLIRDFKPYGGFDKMKNFSSEKEGQLDFYNKFLKRINARLKVEDILQDNTDGVLNGNIIEFKLKIDDISKVLFQAVKYLSSMRVKGKSIPKNIVLVSLNTERAYVFKSEDYLNDIEKIYTGGASVNNVGFAQKSEPDDFDYSSTSMIMQSKLIELLKSNEFTKINLDENCIIGWATRYYSENPSAKKADFIGSGENDAVKITGEIRRPSRFKDFINPYEKETNVKFQYLMDKLNDELSKKDLGAFYTPVEYSRKALELVREAIKRVPEGNDYVIIDRCAGTGNLEKELSDEELSHCIVSTLEYYEYKVLMELIGDKVRHIIPPVENSDVWISGNVKGADALSQEYIENELVKSYINNPKCTIILLENPPYAEAGSLTRDRENLVSWKQSYAIQEMKKEVKGTALNDLANIFIWLAFKYYLRQPTDSYIVFSPIKYWKSQNLISKKFIKGFAFNRKHFHTKTEACISCIHWAGIDDKKTKEIKLRAYDIKDSKLIDEGSLLVKKVHSTITQIIDYNLGNNDKGIVCGLNGLESFNEKPRIAKTYHPDIVAYLVADAFGFDNPRLTSSLIRCGRYNGHGTFIAKGNFLKYLPVFSASRYTDNINNWKIMSMIMKSSDKKELYLKDINSGKLNSFLLKNLLWVSLTNQSHMRSFTGSDKRFYKNELCLDKTKGETLALKELKKLKPNKEEEKILKQWAIVLKSAKKTKNYNKDLSYGTYQIDEELNTIQKIKDSKGNVSNIYDYPELNGHINTLKVMLKDYYVKEIAPVLLQYELVK